MSTNEYRIRHRRTSREIYDTRYADEHRIGLRCRPSTQLDLQHAREKERIVRLCWRACEGYYGLARRHGRDFQVARRREISQRQSVHVGGCEIHVRRTFQEQQFQIEGILRYGPSEG